MLRKQISFIILSCFALTQVGFGFPFSVTGESAQAQVQPQQLNRPQTPKPKFPYRGREVTFVNTRDGTKLVGTLATPFGKGRHAAVILLPGSGAADRVMLAKENLAAIQAALKEAQNRDVTIKELPGLNHYFQTARTGDPMEVLQLEETIAPQVLLLLANWIQAHTRK